MATDAPETVLEMFTVYDHPKDFPDSWVVRRWRIVRGELAPVPDEDPWMLADSHRAIEIWAETYGLSNVGRNMSDDPAIVETWL